MQFNILAFLLIAIRMQIVILILFWMLMLLLHVVTSRITKGTLVYHYQQVQANFQIQTLVQ